MTKIDVQFVDDIPPSRRGMNPGAERFFAFAEALRDNPGKWAVYPFFAEDSSESYRRSIMSAINTENRRAPVGLRSGFQGAYRGQTAYVRWLGDAKNESD